MFKLKEGFRIKLYSSIILFIFIIFSIILRSKVFYFLSVLSFINVCFLLFFFRDPFRKPPEGENLIISPADGRILSITEEYEETFLKENSYKIVIFLNLFNVHINRIPISGRIEYLKYIKGKFYPAFLSKASKENEKLLVGISNKRIKIFLKLIAGTFTRRIEHRLQIGHKVSFAEKFGIIKFGSRIELFLPKNVKLIINPKDKVKGALSIIGKIDEK